MRQDNPGFARAPIPHPLQVDGERLALRLVVVQDVDFLPDELANPDRHRISARASAAYVKIGADLHQRINRDEINPLLFFGEMPQGRQASAGGAAATRQAATA
jgi:hypothetical protein